MNHKQSNQFFKEYLADQEGLNMNKTLKQMRDELAESGSQNGPYQPYNSESFKTGFNCGVAACDEMMGELVEQAKKVNEWLQTKMIFDRTGGRHARVFELVDLTEVLEKYEKWKEEK